MPNSNSPLIVVTHPGPRFPVDVFNHVIDELLQLFSIDRHFTFVMLHRVSNTSTLFRRRLLRSVFTSIDVRGPEQGMRLRGLSLPSGAFLSTPPPLSFTRSLTVHGIAGFTWRELLNTLLVVCDTLEALCIVDVELPRPDRPFVMAFTPIFPRLSRLGIIISRAEEYAFVDDLPLAEAIPLVAPTAPNISVFPLLESVVSPALTWLRLLKPFHFPHLRTVLIVGGKAEEVPRWDGFPITEVIFGWTAYHAVFGYDYEID